MNRYIFLLSRNRNFAIISLIQLLCLFSSWFSVAGVFTLLIELKAPVWAISLVGAFAFIPCIILAPFNGVIIDKFSPFKLLFALLCFEAGTIFCLIFIDDLKLLWLLLILVFGRVGIAGLFFQAEMSLIAKMLSGSQLKSANEIHSLIFSISYTAGMGLAGIFIFYFGVYASFMLDFCFYLIAIFLLTKLKLPNFKQNPQTKAFKMIKEGLIYIKNKSIIFHLICIHALIGATSYDTLIALLANYKYKEILSVSLVIGFLNMTRALSLTAGTLILKKFINKRNLFLMFFGQCFGICFWAFCQENFYLSLFGILFAGFFTNILWAYTFTILQQTCDEEFYGRVLAYNDMAFFAVASIVSLGVGFLFEIGFSLNFITILMGLVFLFGGFYFKILQKNFSSLR